jgi:hypothetical protein
MHTLYLLYYSLKIIIMKKNLVYVVLMLLLVVLVPASIYLSSCQKNSFSDEKTSDVIKIFNIRLEAVNILDLSASTQKNEPISKDEILTKNSIYADLVNNSFSSLLNLIKDELRGDIKKANTDISTLIIYSNNGTTLKSPAEINALSTFTHVNDKLEHHLYKVENGNTTEIKSYHTLTDFIHHGDIRETLLQNTNGANAGWIMVTDLPKIQSLHLQNKLEGTDTYTQVLLANSNNLVAPTAKGCKAGVVCGSDSTSHCQYDLTWYCAAVGCFVGNINDTMSFYNAYGAGNSSLPLNTAYSFRDNFMKNYNIGLKYINYYNSLSAIGGKYNVVSISTAYNWYLFAQKTYTLANKLQNGSNNDIIVDLNFKTTAIAKINLFRTLDHNTQLQAILNDIENDLNFFYNKTRGQILSSIQ